MVLPFHRCHARLYSPGESLGEFSLELSLSLTLPIRLSQGLERQSYSPIAESTLSEVILEGPCPVHVYGRADYPDQMPFGSLGLDLDLMPARATAAVSVVRVLERNKKHGPGEIEWRAGARLLL